MNEWKLTGFFALAFCSVIIIGVMSYLIGRQDGRIFTQRRIASEIEAHNRLAKYSKN